MKRELVMVEWLDIQSNAGWHSAKDARAFKPTRCRDVGWILQRDESSLTLYRSKNSEGDVGDVAVFPAGCIVRVTPLVSAAKAKLLAARPPREGA